MLVNRIVIILTFLSFAITACDSKKVTRLDHENRLSPEVRQTRVLEADAEEVLAQFDADQVEASVRNEALSDKSAEAIFNEIVEPLFSGLMKAEVLEQLHIRFELKTMRLIRSMDTALHAILQKSPESLSDEFLENYYQVVSYGCTQRMRECKFERIFKGSAYSAYVLLEYVSRKAIAVRDSACRSELCLEATQKEQLRPFRDLYQAILLTYEIKPRSEMPRLNFIYLNFFKGYQAWLIHEYAETLGRPANEIEALDYRQYAPLSAQIDLFNSIINNFEVGDPYSPEFRAFIDNFNPWNYSERESSGLQLGTARMFDFASQYYLYDRETGELNPQLKEQIRNYQENGNGTNPSFYQEIQRILEKTPGFFSNYGIDLDEYSPDKLANEYFFIIDRLYNQHISSEYADRIWANSRKDKDLLVSWIIKYLKIEFAKTIYLTNEGFTDIYRAENFSNNEMFEVTVNESYSLNNLWDRLILGTEMLNIFARASIPSFQQNFSSFRELQDFTNSLKSNIKILSIYPNMMILGYFLSALDSPFTFTSWFGQQIEVDPTIVIRYMLNGGFRPWFNYAKDSVKLSKGEIALAYYYIIVSESLDVFRFQNESTGEESITRTKFFEKVLGQYLDPIRTDLDGKVRDFNDNFLSENNLNELNLFCENPSAYKSIIDYLDLGENVLIGSGDIGGSPFGLAFKIYGWSHVNEFQSAAFGYEKEIIRVRNLIDIYFQYLRDKGEYQEGSPEIQQINRIISEIEELREKYIGMLYYIHRMVNDCSDKVYRHTRSRVFDILRDEISYFKQIYQSAKTHGENFDRAKFEEEVGPLLGADNIEYPQYVITKYGAFERITKRLNSTLESVTNSPYTLTDSIGVETRVIELEDTDGIDFINSPNSRQVRIGDSEVDFVRNALRILVYNSGSIFKWLEYYKNGKDVRYKEKVIQNFYKLSPFKVPSELAAQNPDVCSETVPNDSGGQDCIAKIEPQELLEEAVRSREIVSLPEEYKDVLFYIGKTDFMPRNDIKDFIFVRSSDAVIPIFENVYRGTLFDQGYRFEDGTGVMKDAEQAGLALRDIVYLIFPPKTYFCQSVFDSYDSVVKDRFEKIRRLADVIRENRSSNAYMDRINAINLELSIGSSIDTTDFVGIGSQAGAFRFEDNQTYINDRDLRNASNRESLFTRESKNFFNNNNHLSLCTQGEEGI